MHPKIEERRSEEEDGPSLCFSSELTASTGIVRMRRVQRSELRSVTMLVVSIHLMIIATLLCMCVLGMICCFHSVSSLTLPLHSFLLTCQIDSQIILMFCRSGFGSVIVAFLQVEPSFTQETASVLWLTMKLGSWSGFPLCYHLSCFIHPAAAGALLRSSL